MRTFLKVGAVLPIVLMSFSCNIFDFIDSPDDDAQYLSAAQACVDRDDLDCALENYNKVSDANKDKRISGIAFAKLNSAGFTMAIVMRSLGDGTSAGKIFTKMSNFLDENTDGSFDVRRNFHNVYNEVFDTSGNSEISDGGTRGLVRFVTSAAIMSTVFMEANGSDGSLGTSDVSGMSAGTTVFNLYDSDAMTNGAKLAGGTVTLEMINSCLESIRTALGSSELGGSGKFGAKLLSVSEDLSAAGDPSVIGAAAYSTALIAAGFGST